MATKQRVNQILENLGKSQQAFMDIMAQANNTVLYHRSNEDSWTLAEVLVHIAEARDFYTTATRNVLATPGIKMGRTLHYERRLQRIEEHGNDPLALIRQQLITTYEALVELLSQLSDDDLELTGEHVVSGTQTLGHFVEYFVVGHDKLHVRQAKALLEDSR